MKYGAWSLPSGTAVIATGGRHAVELACGDAHESSPWGKPALNVWSAATVASTALLGTPGAMAVPPGVPNRDRKSTRLNSSHGSISYAVLCLKEMTEQSMHGTLWLLL